MIIHDDANMATVVRETVSALKESARHIGKADRAISATEIETIKEAIRELEKALDHKARINLSKP